MATPDNAPYLRELLTGIVEPGTDDARCIRCGKQAALYALDINDLQWFACLDCHGYVMISLIRGERDGEWPPLPPLS